MEFFIILTALSYQLVREVQTRDDLLNYENSSQNQSSALVYGDIGTNLSIPCLDFALFAQNASSIMWDRQGYDIAHNSIVEPDGSLFFINLIQSNSGLYSCQIESPESSSAKTWFKLKVRTPPFELQNVTVVPSSILVSVIWEIGDDGGYPIINFQLRYRLSNFTLSDWSTPYNILPYRRQFDIFHLSPETDYLFELWAVNKLGKGATTLVQASTHNDAEEIQVGEYLLEGVELLESRIWLISVGCVLVTLFLLALLTSFLLYRDIYSQPSPNKSSEVNSR